MGAFTHRLIIDPVTVLCEFKALEFFPCINGGMNYLLSEAVTAALDFAFLSPPRSCRLSKLHGFLKGVV